MPHYHRMHVAVAAVCDSSGRVLLAKRPAGEHMGGLWEFPGGKVEPGETVRAALARELLEELSIHAIDVRPLIRIPYDYDDRNVLLDVWHVTHYEGQPVGLEGQEIEWAAFEQLSRYQMPAANLHIVSALKLPDQYLITPEPGQTYAQWDDFLSNLSRRVERGVRLVQFRAKSLSRSRYMELASSVLNVCRQSGCRVMCNTEQMYPELSDADGLHISSSLLMQQHDRVVSSSKLLSASCHNMDEVRRANDLGCDFIVLGPVKTTASHPESLPIGWTKFSRLCDESRVPVYALGGLAPTDVSEAWGYGAQGVAGISAFW